MLLATMTVTEWGTIIGFMASLVILPIVGHVLQYYREIRKAERDAKEKEIIRLEKIAADKLAAEDRAKTNLVVSKKLDNLTEASDERTKLLVENTELTKATLSFVNGPMAAVRREAAVLAKWKADHTGLPADIRSAEEAEERLQAAVERQLSGGDSSITTLRPKPI